MIVSINCQLDSTQGHLGGESQQGLVNGWPVSRSLGVVLLVKLIDVKNHSPLCEALFPRKGEGPELCKSGELSRAQASM